MRAFFKISFLATLASTLFPRAALAGDAAVVTGFETSEGFHKGGVTRDPDSEAAKWTLPRGGRVYVSGAYASQGALSLAMLGDDRWNAIAKRHYEAKARPYRSASYSFINPDAVHQPLAVTSWIYLFLKDDIAEAARVIQIRTRFGSVPGGANQIVYFTADATGAAAPKAASFSPAVLNLSGSNRLSIDLDYAAKTYTIHLNGAPAVSKIPLPATWAVSNISGIQLISGNAAIPGGWATTYYDGVAVAGEAE